MLNLAVAALAFQAPGIVNPAQHSGMSSIGMSVSRRDVATAALFAGAALSVQPAEAALKPCKSGAQNCWSTASTDKTKLATWTWPKSLSRTEAGASLRAVLDAYPQDYPRRTVPPPLPKPGRRCRRPQSRQPRA